MPWPTAMWWRVRPGETGGSVPASMVMLVRCGQDVAAMLLICGMWLLRMAIISMRLALGVPRESHEGGCMAGRAEVVVRALARSRREECIMAAVRMMVF